LWFTGVRLIFLFAVIYPYSQVKQLFSGGKTIMQYPVILKPAKRNYLLNLFGFFFILSTLSSLFSIIVLKQTYPLYIGPIIGYLLGGLLLWAYDEKTKYKNWAIVINENNVEIPIPYQGSKIRILSPEILDKARTLSHNSKHDLNTKLGYTFWLINGESTSIPKRLYSSSQIKLVLEKLQCL
jgi:hypothetical protein